MPSVSVPICSVAFSPLISSLTFFAKLETVVSTLFCSPSKPCFKPRSRYSPISAQTFDGEWMENTLLRVFVRLLAILLTQEVRDDHALEIPLRKPFTRFVPMLLQLEVELCREVLRLFQRFVTVFFRLFHAEVVEV